MITGKSGIDINDTPVNGATEWKFIEHDSEERANYYERIVCLKDGRYFTQIASKGDGVEYKKGKTNNAPLALHHEFENKPDVSVRPITQEEKERAINMRGRGMGIEPSTVIVSLSSQHGFFASLTTDIEGGLGVV